MPTTQTETTTQITGAAQLSGKPRPGRNLHVRAEEITFGVEIECHLNADRLDDGWEISSNGGLTVNRILSVGSHNSGIAVHHDLIPSLTDGRPESDLLAAAAGRTGPGRWRAENDGSITSPDGRRGVEFVSPILKGQAGLANAVNAVRAIRDRLGARVNRSCGFHVHVGVPETVDDGLRVVQRLASLVAEMENGLFAMTGTKLREESMYCRPIKEAFKGLRIAKRYGLGGPEPEIRVTPSEARSQRYWSLNLQNYLGGEQPTVEFRLFAATLNPVKVAAYVQACIGLVELACKVTSNCFWDIKPAGPGYGKALKQGQREAERVLQRLGWTKPVRTPYGAVGLIPTTPGLRMPTRGTMVQTMRDMAAKYDGVIPDGPSGGDGHDGTNIEPQVPRALRGQVSQARGVRVQPAPAEAVRRAVRPRMRIDDVFPAAVAAEPADTYSDGPVAVPDDEYTNTRTRMDGDLTLAINHAVGGLTLPLTWRQYPGRHPTLAEFAECNSLVRAVGGSRIDQVHARDIARRVGATLYMSDAARQWVMVLPMTPREDLQTPPEHVNCRSSPVLHPDYPPMSDLEIPSAARIERDSTLPWTWRNYPNRCSTDDEFQYMGSVGPGPFAGSYLSRVAANVGGTLYYQSSVNRWVIVLPMNPRLDGQVTSGELVARGTVGGETSRPDPVGDAVAVGVNQAMDNFSANVARIAERLTASVRAGVASIGLSGYVTGDHQVPAGEHPGPETIRLSLSSEEAEFAMRTLQGVHVRQGFINPAPADASRTSTADAPTMDELRATYRPANPDPGRYQIGVDLSARSPAQVGSRENPSNLEWLREDARTGSQRRNILWRRRERLLHSGIYQRSTPAQRAWMRRACRRRASTRTEVNCVVAMSTGSGQAGLTRAYQALDEACWAVVQSVLLAGRRRNRA